MYWDWWFFFFSSRRRHTRYWRDWSSDVCSSDLHPAVIFALTPDGRVARYLHGVQFSPDEVEAALRDAKAGVLMSTQTADVLRCFRFDPASRRAGARAQLFLRVGAALMFGLLFGTIVFLVVWERRRGGPTRSEPASAGERGPTRSEPANAGERGP